MTVMTSVLIDLVRIFVIQVRKEEVCVDEDECDYSYRDVCGDEATCENSHDSYDCVAH